MKVYIVLILLSTSWAMAETTGCQYCIDYCMSVGVQTGQTSQSCAQTCQSLSYTDCPAAPVGIPPVSMSPIPTSTMLPATPPPTGFTTITPTPYPTTTVAPLYPNPVPPPAPVPLPPVPYGWPRAEINMTAGSNCYAHGYRLGNNDVSPTFVSVSYSCDGSSDTSSIINVTGGNNPNGSVGVVFYDPNNVITCVGGADPDMSRNVYVGVLACDSGKTYPITFY